MQQEKCTSKDNAAATWLIAGFLLTGTLVGTFASIWQLIVHRAEQGTFGRASLPSRVLANQDEIQLKEMARHLSSPLGPAPQSPLESSLAARKESTGQGIYLDFGNQPAAGNLSIGVPAFQFYATKWQRIVPAQGRVYVPKGTRISFKLAKEQTSLAVLRKLPAADLISLDCSGSAISDGSLKYVAKFGNLQYLDLTDTEITDIGLKQLRQLKNLRNLMLFNTAVSDQGLTFIITLQNLEYLYLGDTRVTGRNFVLLHNLKKLLVLDLHNTGVEDSSLAGIAEILPHTVALILSGTRVTDAGAFHLKRMPSLSSLAIANTEITDRGLACLEATRLRWLDISGTKIDNSGLRLLSLNKELQELVASGTPISDAGVVELARLGSLERLDLGRTRITDSSGAVIATMKRLRHLRLPSQLSERTVRRLRQSLPGCQIIQDLSG